MSKSDDAGDLLGVLTELFPGVEEAGAGDLEVIERQLGRRPQGELSVARRCPLGEPAVVLTLPAKIERGPAPPLLWLSCPSAAKRMGTLESRSGSDSVAGWLAADSEAASSFANDEERFSEAQCRIAGEAAGEEVAARLAGRGAAGGAKGAIKCLHAHLAYRLALSSPVACDNCPGPPEGGVVGEWCEKMLEREGGIWCERPPSACLP
jgi:hypothetical protein